ncbi:MAG: helix-turn-helix domain-containing protein, partial [Candidatus Omnitrophota bacterium]
TLYKLVKSRKIPGKKVGDNYRFLKSDLIRYFKSD